MQNQQAMTDTRESPMYQDVVGWNNQPRDSLATHDEFLMKRPHIISRERQEDSVTSGNMN